MREVYYVGLDVHKERVQMAVLRSGGTEIESAKGIPNVPEKVVKELQKYTEQGTVQAAYEAGCLGYTLQRVLKKHGIDCRILPPTKIFRGGSSARIKTDQRDAIAIAWMLKRGEAESIAIPEETDEAARDLLRCRSDVKEDLKRTKQRLLKFLLRKGYDYDTNRYWTGRHWKWLKTLRFKYELEQETCDQYVSLLASLEERLKRLEQRIEEVAMTERYRERVQRLRTFKGIDYIIAMALVCEIGDFRRFPTAGSFMSYLGLVPSEYSSGNKRRQGGITKMGNGHIRRLLTEAAWHYGRYPQVGKRLSQRRQGANERVIAVADKALTRLYGKYRRMIFQGKTKQQTITAVSRELSGFIWAVMTDMAV